uniref:Uncharacterized protein n=1 Tax=Buteo japonicus TaxID=224669 RepID=A0A8C0BLD7_9AVES
MEGGLTLSLPRISEVLPPCFCLCPFAASHPASHKARLGPGEWEPAKPGKHHIRGLSHYPASKSSQSQNQRIARQTLCSAAGMLQLREGADTAPRATNAGGLQ